MGSFFAELKRRQMFRVAAAYAVLAWLLLQIVNNVAPVLDLPPWVARAFLLALIVGFPVALFFAWMRELAPSDAASHAATSKLDYALIGALVLVIALVSYQQLAPTGTTTAVDKSGASDTAQTTAAAGVSIAVLPFANVSGDATRDFFSDGMTDEISGALAKVRDLRVIARTSAFEFKGQNRNVRAIGESLGASHLIEGSVRQAGNRVRITAQLVRAGDGVQLWSENYDRELTDIFAIQEDIAQSIAGALRVPLGLGEGETLVSSRTADLDSYQQYLRARAVLRGRVADEGITILEAVVERDPNYAPAWALLSRAHSLGFTYTAAERQNLSAEERARAGQLVFQRVETAAREAIRLDPKHSGGYAALADLEAGRGQHMLGEDLFRQALALDPNDADTLHSYSLTVATFGRIEEALRLREQLRMLEPFVPIYNVYTAFYLQLDGQNDASIRMLEGVSPGSAEVAARRNLYLARSYAEAQRFDQAADVLLAIPTNQNFLSRRAAEDAAQLLRTAPMRPAALPSLPLVFGFAYAAVGASDRILEEYERIVELGGRNPPAELWGPVHASMRKTVRFKVLVRKFGLVDYWRARGWPDLCRPVGADDFVCD